MANLSVVPEDAELALGGKPLRRRKAERRSAKSRSSTPRAGKRSEKATKTGGAKAKPTPTPATVDTPLPRWAEFVKTAPPVDIQKRFSREAGEILAQEQLLGKYTCVAVFDPQGPITQFDVDQVFAGLAKEQTQGQKDVLLFLLSPGGSIEPAYQIAKICKMAAKERFVVSIPRQAKSAATLISLGADEIHMSLLGQLGPIDPQVQGLPALGVSQALETLALLVQKYPGSADMFSSYLQNAVKVEQIGYYDRVTASAVQYAERLLSGKTLPKSAGEIAHELVYEYKDHGFVIDLEEAMEHLGSSWVKTGTSEVLAGDRLYRLFEVVNLFLNTSRSKRLWVAGSFDEGVFIFDQPKRST